MILGENFTHFAIITRALRQTPNSVIPAAVAAPSVTGGHAVALTLGFQISSPHIFWITDLFPLKNKILSYNLPECTSRFLYVSFFDGLFV